MHAYEEQLVLGKVTSKSEGTIQLFVQGRGGGWTKARFEMVPFYGSSGFFARFAPYRPDSSRRAYRILQAVKVDGGAWFLDAGDAAGDPPWYSDRTSGPEVMFQDNPSTFFERQLNYVMAVVDVTQNDPERGRVLGLMQWNETVWRDAWFSAYPAFGKNQNFRDVFDDAKAWEDLKHALKAY